jgi:glycosyltransferase involved in cell wall biosynthesis
MAPAPRISVVIPARDAAATLPATLRGLGQQRYEPGFEVIVVDDASRDDTADIAERSQVVREVLRADGSGPARARNSGAAAARADRLAFLDADCRPTPGWLAAGDSALDGADLVVGHTRPDPNEPIGAFDRTIWVTRASPLFESANLFVRRELFERLGGFQNWLGPRQGKELGEDVWFGWNAVRGGARVTFCEDALAHHALFPRSALAFAAARWRLRFFPAMARRIPELRQAMFYRRYFINERQARFDLALTGIALSALARRPWPVIISLPYARTVWRDLREPDGAIKVLGRTGADAIGFAALITGSIRNRTVLL